MWGAFVAALVAALRAVRPLLGCRLRRRESGIWFTQMLGGLNYFAAQWTQARIGPVCDEGRLISKFSSFGSILYIAYSVHWPQIYGIMHWNFVFIVLGKMRVDNAILCHMSC